MNKKIGVVIVDDEAPARARIEDVLQSDGEIEVLGSFGKPEFAIEGIRGTEPDVVFLDIRMPGMSGLELMQELENDPPPAIIFITAFDSYAVAAFEANAVDYILKPFSDDRLHKALARVRKRLDSEQRRSAFHTLLNTLRQSADGPHRERVLIRQQGAQIAVRVQEIECIEGAGVYVRLHVDGKKYLYRETIGNFLETLDPSQFERVHRSTAVNVDCIDRLDSDNVGEMVVVLKNGSQWRVSRKYRQGLQDRLSR